MLKSGSRNFNLLSAILVKWLKSLGQKQIAPISLLAVLGFTGASWLTTAALAPQRVQAYTASVNVSLNRQPGESYESFVRRAETVARAAAQRSFDRDILVTQVAVTVLGQNDGAIAPILALRVSRQAWRSRPDPQRWARYFPNTQALLRIEESQQQSGNQPTTTPRPAASPQQGTPTTQPGSQPNSGPRVIELPGGNRRVIQIQAPAAAPAAPAAPNGGTPQSAPAPNNQIPEIPGAPIQRIPTR
jgi:hypothetical protein